MAVEFTKDRGLLAFLTLQRCFGYRDGIWMGESRRQPNPDPVWTKESP